MKLLKRTCASILAAVTVFLSVFPNTADAMGGTAGKENAIAVNTSEINTISVMQEARSDSEKIFTLNQGESILINRIGQSYTYVVYVDPEGNESIGGYVLSEELGKYSADEPAAEQETVENSSKNMQYVAFGESGKLSFMEAADTTANKVFDLLADAYLEIQGEYRYVNITYNNEETGDSYTGFVSYDELLTFVDQDYFSSIKEYLDDSQSGVQRAAAAAKSVEKPTVIDVSKWQVFTSAQYDQLAKQVDLVIVRVAYGTTKDTKCEKHLSEFKKRGVPVNVYAYVTKASSMSNQAEKMYSYAKAYDPTFYWIDAELSTISRSDVSAYVKKLRSLVGNAKVGTYVAHHLYSTINVNTSEVDAMWIPRYGTGSGYYESKYNPAYPCDLHQYTETGRLTGYNANLDLSRLTGTKSLSYFTTKTSVSTSTPAKVTYYSSNPKKVRLVSNVNLYSDVDFKKKAGSYKVGKVLTVNGLYYSSDGKKSRLKVSGGYISGAKQYTSTNLNYYSSNPGTIVLTKKLSVYTTVECTKKTGRVHAKDTTVKVTGVAYSKAGRPRLKVSGGYISGYTGYSSQYYTKNPSYIKLTSKLNIYKDVNLKNKTGKTYSKGTKVTVKGIAYTSAGTPRLKVSGGYISGNVKYSYKYFYSNPKSVQAAKQLNIYSDVNLKKKSGRKVKKNQKVTVQGISYGSNGYTRLKVSGGYLSAKAQYFK